MLDLKDKQLILASKSPRRKELLEHAKIPFTIRTKETEENYPGDMDHNEIPEFLAIKKAKALLDEISDNEILLASDTIVIMNDQVLGKPKDKEEASKFIRMISGATHQVITGVCLLSQTKQKSFIDIAEVEMFDMTDDEINWYIDNYQPFDKAGAYGIQDWIGYVKIKSIKGTYATIMGLPIARVYKELLIF